MMLLQRCFLFQFIHVTNPVNSKFKKNHDFCLKVLVEVHVTLILFLISMFGNLSALRLLRIFRSRALIPSNTLTKIGTAAFVMMNITIFFCARDFLIALLALSTTIGVIYFALWSFERRQIDGLKKEIPALLDRWILNMKLGNSLTAAREAALRESGDRANSLLQPLFLSAQSSVRAHLILDAKIMNELLLLAQLPHSALQRLESLRQMMRKTEEFRRRSGQATRQTAIQSSVLLILLLGLAIFTVHRHGWHRNSDFVIISISLSLFGVFCMRKLARKTKWKV